jgi:hypothetical protein
MHKSLDLSPRMAPKKFFLNFPQTWGKTCYKKVSLVIQLLLITPEEEIHSHQQSTLKITCRGLYSAYSSLKSWSWWLTQSNQRPSTIACPIAIACALNQHQDKTKISKMFKSQSESFYRCTIRHYLICCLAQSELEFQMVLG